MKIKFLFFSCLFTSISVFGNHLLMPNVNDKLSLSPISNLHIIFNPLTSKTDCNNDVIFSNLFEITYFNTNNCNKDTNVSLIEKKTMEGLSGLTNNLFFYIGSYQEPDCKIVITNTKTSKQFTIIGTNEVGDYEFVDLPYGTYNYEVTKDCYIKVTGTVVVDKQTSSGPVEVFLNDLTDQTTNNLFFHIGSIQTKYCKITLTDIYTYEQVVINGTNSLGEYKFSNLPFGTYEYSITKDCFAEVTGTVDVDCQPRQFSR